MHRWLLIIFFYVFTLMPTTPLWAQERADSTQKILLGAVIENGDTIAMVYLDDVWVIDKLPKNGLKNKKPITVFDTMFIKLIRML
ncbi:MAG TPA: hypothetical protein PLQ78_03835 [Flavipsychrobacter sp.]|nr:hypothetical protein [Flavipsychrobacter sp.]